MAVGKIGPFDIAKDNWNFYVDRLEQYFIANDVKAAVHVATLISVVGNETYELMVNLCTPEKPSSKNFNDLVKVVQGHLQPKPSILAERFKFRQRIQQSSESVAEYVAELKKLSKYCCFSVASLKENLRDQFVCGLANDYTRQRLFADDDITFEDAFKLAITIEAAEADAALVEDRTGNIRGGTSMATTTVHQMVSNQGRRTGQVRAGRYVARAGEHNSIRSTRSQRDSTGGGASGISEAYSGMTRLEKRADFYTDNRQGCAVCGNRHETSQCKFKRYICRVCNKEGHLKKVCPKLRRDTAIHNINNEQIIKMNNEDSSDEVINNWSIHSDNFARFTPYTIDVCVANQLLTMEIDTGSAISCISYDCFERLFANQRIQNCNLVLRYYTGEIAKPIGKFKPLVKFQDKSKYLDLYVVECGKTSILGRQWISELCINIPFVKVNNIGNHCMEFNVDKFSSRYSEVFSDGLGRFTGGTVGFQLRPNARPVFLRARPLAYALREPVEHTLDQLVRDGIITPVSTSDWATPIVPVMKKDGTIRICGDFKLTLNKCLEVDRFPLPRVEDLLAKLHGGKKFTKLDLSQAYAQFVLDDSKKFTVINTHKGLFRYNRLIYGLASSPGIFQRKLEQLFADMPRVGVFLDDVIITGVDDSYHMTTLHEVFRRLKNYGFNIRKDKCTFFADSVTYLGFIINKDGVHTCPEKVNAIERVKEPSNVSELRSFLGLVMYYAKFVPNISTVLSPLYNLLKKEVKYEWSDRCRLAFNKVKQLLISSKVLAHYAPDLPLVLTTDASSVGVGAVISHITPEGEKPIAYASRVLNTAEKAYSQIEKEALAIIYGVKKYHQYLYGRQFVLRTDHKPLVAIFGDKSGIPVMAASRMQRWAVTLAGYDYKIEYVRSNRNSADALSRLPVDLERRPSREKTYVNFIQDFLPVTRQTILQHTIKDKVLNKIILYINSGWPTNCDEDDTLKPYFVRRNELYCDMGCIVWGYRIVIPTALKDKILKELHVGHLGIVKMKSIARSMMWWPGIDGDIENVCRQCTPCALESTAPPRAPPCPWLYTTEPWTRIHVDFLGPFQGKTFLILIDSTTKWLEVFLMQTTTARAVIKVLRETFARFGLPKEIVSDNGPPFSSREYSEFMSNNGIKITFTAVYHPSSNGAAEGAVKLCKRAIRKSLHDGHDTEAALQAYLMAYRNVAHSTTGVTPAMLLQHRNLRSRLDLLRGERQVEERVRQSQNKQISQGGGVSREFEVGDDVWVQNYAGGEKWLEGRVEEIVGSRNYIVGRESGPPLKRHIDQLKKRWVDLKLPISGQGVESAETVTTPDQNSEDLTLPAREDASGLNLGTNIVRDTEGTNQSSSSPNVPLLNRPKRVRKPVHRYGID